MTCISRIYQINYIRYMYISKPNNYTTTLNNINPVRRQLQQQPIYLNPKQQSMRSPFKQIFKMNQNSRICFNKPHQTKSPVKRIAMTSPSSKPNLNIFSPKNPLKDTVGSSRISNIEEPNYNYDEQRIKSQNNSVLIEPLCINNDGKRAKYRIADSFNSTYCSKCSMTLLKAGTKMVDIQPDDFDAETKITRTGADLVKYQQNQLRLKAELNSICVNTINSIQTYYNQLQITIKEYKSRDLQEVARYKLRQQQYLKQIESDVGSMKDKLVKLRQQIQSNKKMEDFHRQIEQVIKFLLSKNQPRKLQFTSMQQPPYQTISCLLNNKQLNFSFQNMKGWQNVKTSAKPQQHQQKSIKSLIKRT